MRIEPIHFFVKVLIICCLSSCAGQDSFSASNSPSNEKLSGFHIEQRTVQETKLLVYYRDAIDSIKENKVFFKNGKSIVFDDKKIKDTKQLLESPDLEDQFHFVYNQTKNSALNTDAARIRNEAFFKNVYGFSAAEVQKNLVSIAWCPSFVNQRIQVTKKCGVADSLRKVSAALDKHPEWKKYLTSVGGTFNWRKISGTNRLSAHSFGITIDINVAHSNYWQWDCSCTDETKKIAYRNSIPYELVEIFEKYGFVWGGKWVHYDTMHFEFRPELVR